MRLIITLLVFLMLGCTSVGAQATEIPGENFYNNTVEKILSGELSMSPTGVINGVLKGVYAEVANTKGLVKTILIIAALSGILRVLSDAFAGEVSEAAHFASFSVMSGICIKIFAQTVGYGVDIIHLLCDFITKFQPIFVGLLVSSGAVTQAAAFQPVLVGSVYILSVLVDKCILPMTYFSAVLGIVSNISGKMSIGSLNKLMASGARWLLTGVLTLFSAILTIYGFGTSALNNVAAKGIKFAVGSLVPVVGGLLSDTVETVISGTHLLKNAVGAAGMITVITAASIPVIKIWIMLMLLKITAAVVEPFSDKRIVGMLSGVSESVTIIFSMVITAVMLFVISIGIILMFAGVSL